MSVEEEVEVCGFSLEEEAGFVGEEEELDVFGAELDEAVGVLLEIGEEEEASPV